MKIKNSLVPTGVLIGLFLCGVLALEFTGLFLYGVVSACLSGTLSDGIFGIQSGPAAAVFNLAAWSSLYALGLVFAVACAAIFVFTHSVFTKHEFDRSSRSSACFYKHIDFWFAAGLSAALVGSLVYNLTYCVNVDAITDDAIVFLLLGSLAFLGLFGLIVVTGVMVLSLFGARSIGRYCCQYVLDYLKSYDENILMADAARMGALQRAGMFS